MNADPDVVLADWLDEGPTQLPEDARQLVLTSIRSIPQERPGWGRVWRFTDMLTGIRLVAAAAAAMIVVVGGIYLIAPPGSDPGIGGPGASATASPPASPLPSTSWPPDTLPLGTLTLTDSQCHAMGFRDIIGPGQEPASIALFNDTTNHATFGWYRLNAGRTWAEATAWLSEAHQAIADDAGIPPADFVTELQRFEVEPGRRDYLVVPVGQRAGTYGLLCSAGEARSGPVLEMFLVGPITVE